MNVRRQVLRSTAPVAAPAPARELGVFRAIWSDLRAFAELKGTRFPSLVAVVDALLMPGVMATIVFRFAHALHRARLRPLSRLLYIWNVIVFGCDLAPGASIGPGLAMPHPVAVGIGKDVRIGANAHVMGLVRLGGAGSEDPAGEGMPVIGDGVWLLDGCKVFGPVTIGDDCIIGAAAVVVSSIPAGMVAAGIPARVIRPRPGRSGG